MFSSSISLDRAGQEDGTQWDLVFPACGTGFGWCLGIRPSVFRQRGGGLDSFHECLALFCQGAEVAFGLDTAPEVIGLTKEYAKADRHGGRDGTLA